MIFLIVAQLSSITASITNVVLFWKYDVFASWTLKFDVDLESSVTNQVSTYSCSMVKSFCELEFSFRKVCSCLILNRVSSKTNYSLTR